MSSEDQEDVDHESAYSQLCAATGDDAIVIVQNTQRLSATADLFYTDVLIQDAVELRAMLDSGSFFKLSHASHLGSGQSSVSCLSLFNVSGSNWLWRLKDKPCRSV